MNIFFYDKKKKLLKRREGEKDFEKVDPPTRRRKCKERWKVVVFRWWGGVWFILGVGTRRCLIVFARFYEAQSGLSSVRDSVYIIQTYRSGISFVYIYIDFDTERRQTRDEIRRG